MADSSRQGPATFRVHTSGKSRRGSKLLTALLVLVVVGGGGAVGWFVSDDARLLGHLRERDRLAVPAVYALTYKGPPAEAKADLVKGLEDAEDPGLRAACAWSLGRSYGDDRRLVIDVGHAAVNDPEPVVREAAVEALGDLGHDNAKRYLIEAFEDPDAGVQAAACAASGQLLLGDLIPYLIDALGRPDQVTRQAALDALEEYTEGELSFGMDRKAWTDWYNRG